jgi:lipoate---protein ligase
VPVVARRGGGGVVVLAPGMVVSVVVGNRLPDEPIKNLHLRIHRAFIAILDPEGRHKICHDGISDLCIGDRKILGSSLYLGNDPFFFYYQSSLLVHADLACMDRYLKPPLRQPEYRKDRPHGLFCTTMQEQGAARSCAEISRRLTVQFYSEFQKYPVSPPDNTHNP